MKLTYHEQQKRIDSAIESLSEVYDAMISSRHEKELGELIARLQTYSDSYQEEHGTVYEP